MQKILTSLVISMFILSCGGQPGATKEPAQPPVTPPTDPKNPQKGSAITLVVFSAPWCPSCETKVPEIDRLLKAELTEPNSRLKGQLLVTSGNPSSKRPTLEIATAYRNHLNVSLEAGIDEWYYKSYRKYVQEDPALPAVVILNEKGERIKTFYPGQILPEEIAAFVKEKLK